MLFSGKPFTSAKLRCSLCAAALILVLLAIAMLMFFSPDDPMQASANAQPATDAPITMLTSVPPSHHINAQKESESTTTTLLYKDIPVSEFRVENLTPSVDTEMDYTLWWYSEKDDCRYLFLPATADTNALRITCQSDDTLYLNDKPLASGETTDIFSEESKFSVRVGKKDCGMLHVMRSDLPCIYMELESGSLAYVEKKNGNKEGGNILMLNPDSSVEYNGPLESIGAHGNSSWDYSKKKPYNIKLPQKAKLYGMGKAKKWALLSNYLDHGMIRNSVAMMLSEDAGCEFTMQYTYVDLYAHGEYRGTYQLFERVQTQKHRVNITDLEEENEAVNPEELESYPRVFSDGEKKSNAKNSYKYWEIPNNPDDITGGYLLQFQTNNRYPNKADSGFVTSRGQCVQVDTPEHASEAQILYIRQFVQDLEDAIYSETGYNDKGKHYSDYLDVDSIIRSFLIQEITANADGSYTSFYFWKESDALGDGKLHCGPVWDFDLGFANFRRAYDKHACCDTDDFFAMFLPIHRPEDEDPILGWLGTLYNKEDYQQRVREIYFESFDSQITTILNEKIPALETHLTASAAMNNARWDMLGKNRPLGPVNGYTYSECVSYISDFLSKHQKFISSQWFPEAKQVLANQLASEMNKLPLHRYDNEGLEQLKKKMAHGQASILAADDYETAQKAYAAAVDAFYTIEMAKFCGDYDDDGYIDSDDATAILVYYTKALAEMADPPTDDQMLTGDVNRDQKLDSTDAMHILIHYAYRLTGDDYPLPVTKPQS